MVKIPRAQSQISTQRVPRWRIEVPSRCRLSGYDTESMAANNIVGSVFRERKAATSTVNDSFVFPNF
jgi:hypothetical protein